MKDDFTFSMAKLYGFNEEIEPKTPDLSPITAFLEFNSQNFKGYKEIDEASGFWQPTDLEAEFFEDSRGMDLPARHHNSHNHHNNHNNHNHHHHHSPPEPNRHNHSPNDRINQGGAPRSAPPSYTPAPSSRHRQVDSAALSSCMFTNTYIWLKNGQSFWFFPTFVGRRTVSGFRWAHHRWVFVSFNINDMEAFFVTNR